MKALSRKMLRVQVTSGSLLLFYTLKIEILASSCHSPIWYETTDTGAEAGPNLRLEFGM